MSGQTNPMHLATGAHGRKRPSRSTTSTRWACCPRVATCTPCSRRVLFLYLPLAVHAVAGCTLFGFRHAGLAAAWQRWLRSFCATLSRGATAHCAPHTLRPAPAAEGLACPPFCPVGGCRCARSSARSSRRWASRRCPPTITWRAGGVWRLGPGLFRFELCMGWPSHVLACMLPAGLRAPVSRPPLQPPQLCCTVPPIHVISALRLTRVLASPPPCPPACSFWNFDALFQPQQHPARDAHDTFFLTSKRPALVVC